MSPELRKRMKKESVKLVEPLKNLITEDIKRNYVNGFEGGAEWMHDNEVVPLKETVKSLEAEIDNLQNIIDELYASRY